MKNLLLLVVLVILTLASCRTRLERAERYLDKAIKLNPNVVSTKDTLVVIDTLLLYKDTLFIPADTTKFQFQIDSLKKEGKQTIFENDKLKVEIRTIKETKDGKVTYRQEGIVTNKEKLITRTIKVPFYITKVIPAKLITKTITLQAKRGVFWWVGLGVCILGISFIGYKAYRIWRP